jgi:hypothetical protein
LNELNGELSVEQVTAELISLVDGLRAGND